MAKGAKESDVVLNFRMNGEVAYSKTIKEINNDMKIATLEYKNQMSAMDKNASAAEKLAAAKQKLEKQLGITTAKTAGLREEYEKSAKETGENSEKTQKLYEMLLKAETSENNLKKALESTNEALDAQGDKALTTAEKIEKIEQAGEKIKGAGEKLSIGVTAPIVATASASLLAFNEVDEALDTIITKTGATGDVADRLGESFENIAGNTHLEMQTVGDAIGAVYSQFGFLDDQLESTTDYMLKFAEINDTDVTQSAAYGKQAIEAYNLSYNALNSVLDATTQTSQRTGVEVDKLFENAINGAPQIKQLGLSFGEGVTLMGQFEQAGVDSSAALSSLSKATVIYAKDGKSLAQGMSELQDKIKNAKSETEAINLASEIFGTKGGPRMADAIKRGTLNLDDLAKVAEESNGTVGETFDATLDPIDKAAQAMNNAKLLLSGIGESIQIALLPALEMAIVMLKDFKNWFDGLNEGQRQTIITIAGIIAAIGPFLVILGTLMGSISQIVNGIKAIQVVWTGLSTLLAANPFVLIIAGIALLIAGLVLAYSKVEWFRNGVNGFFNGIKDVAIGAFQFLGGFIIGVFDGVWMSVSGIIDNIKKIFTGLIDFVSGIFSGDWSKAWNGIVGVFSGIFGGIVSIAKLPINNMISLLNGFIGGLNKIKIPKWVPGTGGKGFDIDKIPYLAKGGHVLNGQAIVGEAGPELLTKSNGRTTVTPLSQKEKEDGIGGKLKPTKVEQHIHIGNIDANNPSELNKTNRKLYRASQQALAGIGGS